LECGLAPDIEVGYFGSFVTSTPLSPLTLRRYRAERLLRREFAGLRSKVLSIVRSQLRSRGVTLDVADLEACYAQAWHGLYATVLGGEEVENPSAWLVLVTFRRAIDESRSAPRHQLVDGGEQPVGFNPDLAGALDDRARLRQVLEGLRSRLSQRECQAASLYYLQGLSRSEAAERMGISEPRMRKLLEGASPSRPGVAGKVGALLDTIKAGGWCEQQSSLMRAFAFGILDPDGERHALARIHQRECPACRAYVLSLRGLASVLPPLPLSFAAMGGAGAAAGSGATAGGSSAAAATGGTLTAKLAAIGVLALGVGGGYTLLAGGAPGHTGHRARAQVPAGVPAPPKHFSAPAHRARSHSARRTRPVPPLPSIPASSGQDRPSPEASTSLGEFLPERVPSGR